MNFKWLTSSVFIGLASLFIRIDLSVAQENSTTQFFCGAWRDTPMTIARTPRGDVPVIYWVTDWVENPNSGLTPQRRCEIVSDNFQRAYDGGELKYLTVGRKNNENIVCVAEYDGGPCSSQLFTLKPGSNPQASLLQLMNINRAASSGPLEQNTGEQRLYVDFEDFIEKAALSEN